MYMELCIIRIYLNCHWPNPHGSRRGSNRVNSPASRCSGQVVRMRSMGGSRPGHVARSRRPGHLTRVTSFGRSPPAVWHNRLRRSAVREDLETIWRPRRESLSVTNSDTINRSSKYAELYLQRFTEFSPIISSCYPVDVSIDSTEI